MSAAPGRRSVLAALALALAATGCGGAQDDAAPSTVATALEIGAPDPPLPVDVNEVPYGIGQPAALGNLQVTMMRAIVSDTSASITVTVRNGALDSITLPDDTFRLYLQDGSSVVMADDGSLLGSPLESGATIEAELAAPIDGDDSPALVLVNGTSADERMLPGAFVLGTLSVETSDGE